MIIGTKQSRFNQIVDDAILFIEENISENITIYDICEYLEISESYFIKIFKSITRITPHAYIVAIKIEKAKELLSKGEDVTDVVYQIGFFDQSHLSRVFKKYEQITPYEYKKLFVS